MQFDPANGVVKLCSEGMALEAQGKKEEAQQLFQQAWNEAANDFEAFTAAHYLARNQKDPADNLYWNEEALKRALLVKDDLTGVYPSLYLNIGRSHETLGNRSEAASNYQLAADAGTALPTGAYGDMIRSGIREGLKRTGAAAYTNIAIEQLVSSWCEKKELKPLAFILPAYVGNSGTEADINKLISAFSYLSATHCLNAGDQLVTDRLIRELSTPGSPLVF